MVRQALEELLVEFREVLALRDLEEMSYRDIASITDFATGYAHISSGAWPQAVAAALTNHMHAEVLS
jgi:Sigma-70, region 4